MWVLDIWPETLQLVRVGRIPFFQKLLRFFMRQIYQSCDLIFATSNEAAAVIKKTSRNSIIKLLPNWVEPEYQEFKYASKRSVNEGGSFNICMQET